MIEEARKLIKPVSDCPLQALFSDKYQLHDVLEILLEQTGKADVIITCLSMSEEFVRKIAVLKDKSLINNATICLDHKAAVKVSQLLTFSVNVFDKVYLCANHSKIILIKNTKSKIGYYTSQNPTRGNRNECGIICTDPLIFDDIEQKLTTLFKDGIEWTKKNLSMR